MLSSPLPHDVEPEPERTVPEASVVSRTLVLVSLSILAFLVVAGIGGIVTGLLLGPSEAVFQSIAQIAIALLVGSTIVRLASEIVDLNDLS